MNDTTSNSYKSGSNKSIILINNFYAYISFVYQFLCFLIYMILFWLYYKYSGNYIGNFDSRLDHYNQSSISCASCFSNKRRREKTEDESKKKSKHFNDDNEIISLKSNDFSYHFSYPQQHQHVSVSSLSSETSSKSDDKFCCCFNRMGSIKSRIKTTILKSNNQKNIFSSSTVASSASSSSSSESSFSSPISSTKLNSKRGRTFNIRLFIIVISIILFLINIILIKICFKSDIFKIENSIYNTNAATTIDDINGSGTSSSSNNVNIIKNYSNPVDKINTTALPPKWLISYKYLFNDTDGVIDVVLFILIFYLFNLIKPIFIMIITTCLLIIQSIFIIIFNKTNITDSAATAYGDVFKVYIQVEWVFF